MPTKPTAKVTMTSKKEFANLSRNLARTNPISKWLSNQKNLTTNSVFDPMICWGGKNEI